MEGTGDGRLTKAARIGSSLGSRISRNGLRPQYLPEERTNSTLRCISDGRLTIVRSWLSYFENLGGCKHTLIHSEVTIRAGRRKSASPFYIHAVGTRGGADAIHSVQAYLNLDPPPHFVGQTFPERNRLLADIKEAFDRDFVFTFSTTCEERAKNEARHGKASVLPFHVPGLLLYQIKA